ncbi:BamA/TamA family outer membrane protein [Bradyrhizobium sp. CCGUVB23]|uniref:BamA/TamA family outer membrane protein n=1 Tax=Bradyrhizobium sp. CCGUVB23 TaxID=2949630 RepID=UPI0035319994
MFYDGGSVHVSGFHFARPYRDAVGFGFRYNTPVGPVALDIAFKINPAKAEYGHDPESPFRVQFYIGTF